MFPEGIPDLQSLMSRAAEMQHRVVSAQEELAELQFEGTAGGGLVSATVTGTGELVGITIDPSVVDPAETETLADLVVAAVHDASATAQRHAAQQMDEITGGFGGELEGAGGAPEGTRGALEGGFGDEEQPPPGRLGF